MITHDQLIEVAVRRLRQAQYDLVRTNFTPYQSEVVFDVIAFRRRNREIRIIECKANRGDFLSDNKWSRYLPYCTHLGFFGHSIVFLKEEVPEKIGVIRLEPIELLNRDPIFGWRYERGCRHLHDMGPQEYLAVLEGFVGCYSRCSPSCQRKTGG